MILAHHAAVEALALFVPALAIVGVIATAVVLDRRRAEEDEEGEGPAAGEGDAGRAGGDAEPSGVHPGRGVAPGAEGQGGGDEAEVEQAAERAR
jgi:hypothetical protein